MSVFKFYNFLIFYISLFKSFLNLMNDKLLKNNLSKGFRVAEELTQEQMAEWAYLSEDEQTLTASSIQEKGNKEQQVQDINLSKDAQQAVEILSEKELIDAKVKERQQELDEFKSPKAKREFVKDRLDSVEKNESLKESLQILKEKEKIEEQIKAKEEQIAKREKGEEKEQSPQQNESQRGKENSAEQEDWNKRADELEMQHEKELEDLKDKQSKLEANFQKSIDNLMNSDGINNIITALQEMDRSLEMMLKQGKEESIAKDRQRQEKLDLAFDSPKFKEAVGDLVKEVYTQRKKVKGGFKEMENERANYAKLQTTYEKETKKGLDVKGYEKLKKMMGDIEKETPNFKDSYPKFYQKVNDTLALTKDKILNKAKGQENENDRGRSL